MSVKAVSGERLDPLWSSHHAEWRDPSQITSHWKEASETDPALLRCHTRGRWWDVLAESGVTLLVTREYEHLVLAISTSDSRPLVTFMRMPHPSGLVVDHVKQVVHVASTRNPNQIFAMRPVTGVFPRLDVQISEPRNRPLLPFRSYFYPGCLYLHDLALIGGALHGSSVGQNAVVRLEEDGSFSRVWWPRCIEGPEGAVFGRNHIQLNSIAAGHSVGESFFSASAEKMTTRRPGHRNFPVDGRGVIFSGSSRQPIARGLTRPHSARLYRRRIWVSNSGYGQVGFVDDERLRPVAPLPGWTRGLFFQGRIAFAGTSRVIPRFRQYAPGLDVDSSLCGVHAFDLESGEVLGSLIWPAGNQIFAIDGIDRDVTRGFPFTAGTPGARGRLTKLFYVFQVDAPLKRRQSPAGPIHDGATPRPPHTPRSEPCRSRLGARSRSARKTTDRREP